MFSSKILGCKLIETLRFSNLNSFLNSVLDLELGLGFCIGRQQKDYGSRSLRETGPSSKLMLLKIFLNSYVTYAFCFIVWMAVNAINDVNITIIYVNPSKSNKLEEKHGPQLPYSRAPFSRKAI